MNIPDSFIIETGYDQGRNFVISDSKQPYTGFYHRDKNDRYWTGEKHTSSSVLLIKVSFNPTVDDFLKYNYLTRGFTVKYDKLPSVSFLKGEYVPPNEEDYTRGYFTRYIAQHNLSKAPYVVEISKGTFDEINSSINRNYYITVSLIWKISGTINDVYRNNIRVESGIIDTNLRSIQQAKKTIKDIELLLNNPGQYIRDYFYSSDFST
jgi:hypothetical protein